jgi:hypothetical protein
LNGSSGDPAYGWSPDLSDDEILAALGALHQARQGNAVGDGEETTETADDSDH